MTSHIEPISLPEGRGWHPKRMTPEQIAEIRAAGEVIAAKWAEVQAAMLEALRVQKRTQGGWPVDGRGPARRARQDISLFLYHLYIKPEIELPEWPNSLPEEAPQAVSGE